MAVEVAPVTVSPEDTAMSRTTIHTLIHLHSAMAVGGEHGFSIVTTKDAFRKAGRGSSQWCVRLIPHLWCQHSIRAPVHVPVPSLASSLASCL